jgi:hypothetical protein
VPERPRTATVAVAALNLWAFSAFINPTLDPGAFAYRPRVIANVPKEGEGRVFTALRDQVWMRYLNYDDFGPDSARYAHELTDTLAPNIGMRFGIEEGSGYEPVPVKAVTEVDALVRAALERRSPSLPRLHTLFNVHVLLLPEATRYSHPALEHIDARGVTSYGIRAPGARMWLVRSTWRVDGGQRALSAVSSPDFDPLRTAIVSEGNGLSERFDNEVEAAIKAVTLDASEPERVAATADAGGSPAFLVWSETWYPGWRVNIDGSPAQIVRTNHAFQGVVIPPGTHRIEFTYRPASYRVGLYLTCACLSFISGGIAFGFSARRGKRRFERSGRGIHRVSGVQSIP